MPLITKADLRVARQRYAKRYTKSAALLLEAEAGVPLDTEFDIFLSHSYRDAKTLNADELASTKDLLEEFEFSVYVDWVVDHEMSRDKVTPKTAARLRHRLTACKSLLFVTSATSSQSKWMPWELGYKDAHNGRVAVLPIVDQSANAFYGQEYLGLYPFVTKQENTKDEMKLWINCTDGRYVQFSAWLNGKDPYEH